MADSANSEHYKTVDHLFRREAGKMVSVLARAFGLSNIEDAEDIVQDTILRALEIWKWGKVPEKPQAWLYRAARNRAIDMIRRKKLRYKIDSDLAVLLQSEYSLAPTLNELFTEGEIKDSQLRMMFAVCHPSISEEAQITFILKTLCGLSVKEIGSAFLTGEETVRKRLYRTREKIRNEAITLEFPGPDAMTERIEPVLKALYLLFNEGYNSSHPQQLIREDLCGEAMRLAILLSENSRTSYPQTNALLALFCFQASRFDARMDNGLIILLKEQDRRQWNKSLIAKGNEYLFLASRGDAIHDFHIEAGIASNHANADSFEETDWKSILLHYDMLLLRTNNPIVSLNRCLAVAEVAGNETAIAEMKKLHGLEQNCYYRTSLGELYLRVGNKTGAKLMFEKALEVTSSAAEAELIRRKIGFCD